MEKKQNSIDWLISCVTEDQMVKAKSLNEWLEIFEQAKAMHKEEIISFAKKCLDKALDLDVRTAHSKLEEMYAETFGGDDE